jgi:mono/diheme cytochrome c family protein
VDAQLRGETKFHHEYSNFTLRPAHLFNLMFSPRQYFSLLLVLALAFIFTGSALATVSHRQLAATFYSLSSIYSPFSIFHLLTFQPSTFNLLTPNLHPPPDGAALFRQWCSSCHGDRGQGLTAEWRAKWPEGKQYCWQSKCHAANHPPDGFSFPKSVPALIGPDTLGKFSTGHDLYVYIRATMPYWSPGMLEDEQYQAIAAYLVKTNYNQRQWSLPAAWPANLSHITLSPQPSNLQAANVQPANFQPFNLQPANLHPSNPQPPISSSPYSLLHPPPGKEGAPYFWSIIAILIVTLVLARRFFMTKKS